MNKLWSLIKSTAARLVDNLVRQSLERNKDFLERIKKGGGYI